MLPLSFLEKPYEKKVRNSFLKYTIKGKPLLFLFIELVDKTGVMYHELEDETTLVFHVMECRKKWLVKLGLEE
jgi:hypothetical protein